MHQPYITQIEPQMKTRQDEFVKGKWTKCLLLPIRRQKQLMPKGRTVEMGKPDCL